MRQSHVLWILLSLGVAALGAACGGSDSPTGPGDQGPYVFSPPPGAFTVDVFDSFRVSVRRTDGEPVNGVFYVGEDSVASGGSYAWWASTLGLTEIKVLLPGSPGSAQGIWAVTVSEGASPAPSAVTQLEAGRGEVAGSINVGWERPNRGYESIDHYRIYYAESEIDSLQLEGLDFVDAPHHPTSVQQEFQVVDLQERLRYYFRIQIVDLIGRESDPSPQASSLSTGHYDVSGRITRLVQDAGGAEGFASVLVEVGEYKTLTDPAGYYQLNGIPDVLADRLRAKSSSEPFNYYRVESDTLGTTDQTLDLLLIRRSLVRVDVPEPKEIFMLDFLLSVTGRNSISSSGVIHRWETYPIPVMVDPFVVDPGGGDAGMALADGIQYWNQEAGEDMFVAVMGSPSYGADYVVVDNQPVGGGILGEVIMIDPADPRCLFQCSPTQVRVNISDNNTPSVMERVAVHELGHVLWMAHSPTNDHVMSAGILGSSSLIPKRDEVLAARYIKHIPNGTDLRWYKDPEF